jgi:hypothetical protein
MTTQRAEILRKAMEARKADRTAEEELRKVRAESPVVARVSIARGTVGRRA